MPIYEYACRACEHQFESIQKASEEPLRDCPACGEATLRKLLSAPVFRLKGSGWYETDFKTGDKRNVADAQAEQGKEAGKEPGKEKAGDKADKGEQAAKAEPAKSGAGEANGKGSQAPKTGAAKGGDAKPAKAAPSSAGITGNKRGDGGKGAGGQPKRSS